jgi:hypothetical protein
MADEELLQRLEETSPDQWSEAELEELRVRAQANPAVREALAEQVWLDQTLTRNLTQTRITAEQVLARYDERRRAPRFIGSWLRVAAVLLLAGGLGGIWYKQSLKPPDERPIVEKPIAPPNDPPPLTPRVKPTATPSATPKATPSATAAAPETTPPPVAAVIDPDEPWAAMLGDGPRTFDDFCFAERRLSRDLVGLQRWWTTTSGQQRPVGSDDRYGLHMGGAFQLRAPWPADAALSLWLTEQQTETLKIHIWSGPQGLTLERRQRPYEQWTAHVTTKRPNEPLPATMVFAATDNDRARRTGDGPLDLRYHNGRIYFSRGDILLLTAPLPNVPDGVNMEGATVMRGIGLARLADLPKRWTEPEPQLPSFVEYADPINWRALSATQWTTDLPPGAKFERDGDEGGTLRVVDSTKAAYASFPLPKDGLYDLVWEIESADEQTGFYLGTGEGFPRFPIGFYEYKPGENLIVFQGRPAELKPRARYQGQYPLPSVAFPTRLRTICGAGIVKVYGSVDGRSWGRIMEPFRTTDDSPSIVGIYCNPGKGTRQIKLTRIRASNYLQGDPELVAGVPSVRDQGDYTNWLLDVLARDRNSLHRSAAALLARGTRYDIARTLLAGLGSPPAEPMIDDVSNDVRAAGKPPEAEKPLDFESLAWAADTSDGYSTAEWEKLFLARIADYRPAEKAEPLDRFTFARRRWMESSMAAPGKTAVPLPQKLIRDEVVQLLRAGRWNDLDELCRVLHFFGGRPELQDRRYPNAREPIMNLVDYAAAQAERRRNVPDGVIPTPAQTTFKPEWRHPLIEQFGKEGYNVLAELETALQEKAYSDACRIITGVTAVQAIGLLPNAADSDLLVSLPGAVALAMRDHAELRNVMQREHGALAQLRLRQATADGDVDAVQALTTQFYGTVAAAQAQMWLGDRALAQGDAARAEGCYFATRTELPAADRAAIDARIRMAAAMQGRNFGGAPTSAVTLGEWTLSPTDFERTIEDLRKQAPQSESRTSSAVVDAGAQGTSPIPPPSRFTLKSFAKVDGEYGKNPEQLPNRDVDYIGRQMASVHLEEKGGPGKILVANRFQVVAYALADGKQVWRTGLGAEQGRAYHWPLVPMPPVVDEGRIFVRRITAQGPELACLNVSDGVVLWRSPRGEVIASDPLVIGDRVEVVSLLVPQQEIVEAVLTTFELRTGKVMTRRPLVQLRDYWRGELNCKLFLAGDMLLAKIGGCVIGCNSAGELRWLRRLPWIPPSVATWPMPPEMESERLAEGKFIINGTNGDSYRIDVRTGSVELYAADDAELDVKPEDWIPPSQAVVHGDDWFAVHESSFGYGKLWRPRMYWQSKTSGATDAAWPNPWTKEHPAVGPIFTAGGRHFVFTAADLKAPVREIMELVPGESLASEAPDVKNGGLERQWCSLAPDSLRNLPPAAPWQLLQSRYDEKLWLDNKMFLQDDCRLTQALPTVPAVWTRTVGLPSTAPKVLRLRVAAAGSEPWQLTVRVNERVVLDRKIEPVANASDLKARWRDEKIDLKPFAGRTVQLTLIHSPISTTNKNPPPSLAGWQRMEIVDP